MRSSAPVASKGTSSRTKGLDFRFADEEDVEDILLVVNNAYEIEIGDSGEAYKTCDRVSESEVLDSIDSGGKRWYISESSEDDVVACVCFSVDHEEKIGSLDVFAVNPEFQNKGIGTSVLRRTEAMLASLGARTAVIKTAHWRENLIEWCGKRGYRETGGGLWPEEDAHQVTRTTRYVKLTKQLGGGARVNDSAPTLPTRAMAGSVRSAGAPSSMFEGATMDLEGAGGMMELVSAALQSVAITDPDDINSSSSGGDQGDPARAVMPPRPPLRGGVVGVNGNSMEEEEENLAVSILGALRNEGGVGGGEGGAAADGSGSGSSGGGNATAPLVEMLNETPEASTEADELGMLLMKLTSQLSTDEGRQVFNRMVSNEKDE